MESSVSGSGAGADATVVLLPDDVINQIAAGEVVERPASVVKELLDNALDAGAGVITVESDGGGKARLRVTDDGRGMSAVDARQCFVRHATSKIQTLDDLRELATMGFRGEALSSISSVSRTVLTTRRRGDLAATRVIVEHGHVASVTEVGAAVGTSLEITELFAKVPARLKFLKGETTEASHVTEAVTRFAMAHPGVHVRLLHNGRAALEVAPDKDGLSRARALVGGRLAQRLHRVAGEEAGIAVEAFLAAPELAQTTARGVQLFVGRRAVRDRGLLHAVAMGYGELVPRGRYPVAIVFLEAPAGTVDFNVHPQKSEVRFSDASAVAAAVRHVVRAGVSASPWLRDSAAAATLQLGARAPGWGGEAAAPRAATPLAHRYVAALARPGGPLGRAPFPRGASEELAGASRWSRGVAEGAAAGWSDVAHAVRALVVDPEEPAPAAPASAQAAPAPKADAGEREAGAGVASAGAGAEARGSVGATGAPAPAWPSAPWAAARAAVAASAEARRDRAGAPRPATEPPSQPALPGEAAEPAGFFSSLRFLGQLDLTYLVCEAAGELVLIDQHAAHERVQYQRLLERRREGGAIASQRLLFPATVEVPREQLALVEEHAELWATFGFELEPFGATSVAVKAAPVGLRGADAPTVLRELLDEWLDAGASRAVERRVENLLATVACHSAVRAGDRLSAQEAEAMLRSMDEVESRAHCPHGRPALLRLSLDEIARRFGR
ncbi:MAG: DNA mismatch repair endonuclease MutL [Kofleriaceae bacterium]